MLRITQNIWPDSEGSEWLHRLAANSVPFGSTPAPGELPDGNGQPAPPPAPARAPQGARDGLPERVGGDQWLRAAVDEATGRGGWEV